MRLFVALLVTVCAAGSAGCSLKKMAVNTVATTLSEVGTIPAVLDSVNYCAECARI